jgi:hypothetical protein
VKIFLATHARGVPRVIDKLTGQLLNPEQHHATEACADVHCWAHQVDERSRPCFVTCFECQHVYPRSWSLWWAYLRTTWAFRQYESRPEMAAQLWRAARCRPSRLTFCPVCTHDF